MELTPPESSDLSPSNSLIVYSCRRPVKPTPSPPSSKIPAVWGVEAVPRSCGAHIDRIMAPRWKGKSAEAKALADPMSSIVSRLQSSLSQSNSQALLSGCSVLLPAHPDQTELLNQACFGRPIISTEKDKQWFQLSLEEALYLCSVLKCIKITGEDKCSKSDNELWLHMLSKKVGFLYLFKVYSHLRMKNWVVRAGSQYGVDFVAYRHHPALVHSEYSVIVLSGEDESRNTRLKAWSDFHCTLRLCGSVAKTLLILYVNRKNNDDDDGDISSSGLKGLFVEERTVTRWNPEENRENQRNQSTSETRSKDSSPLY